MGLECITVLGVIPLHIFCFYFICFSIWKIGLYMENHMQDSKSSNTNKLTVLSEERATMYASMAGTDLLCVNPCGKLIHFMNLCSLHPGAIIKPFLYPLDLLQIAQVMKFSLSYFEYYYNIMNIFSKANLSMFL